MNTQISPFPKANTEGRTPKLLAALWILLVLPALFVAAATAATTGNLIEPEDGPLTYLFAQLMLFLMVLLPVSLLVSSIGIFGFAGRWIKTRTRPRWGWFIALLPFLNFVALVAVGYLESVICNGKLVC